MITPKDLEARSLGSDADREAWLLARRSVVTATEAKRLLLGGPKERQDAQAEMLHEKVTGEQSFTGNHFTQWGKLREPVILDELAGRGVVECGLLVHAVENPRHAATPDGVVIGFDGDVEALVEIKTSKNDVSPGSGKTFDGYNLQMQWQMHCTGATRVLYVWERHDNVWGTQDMDALTLENGPTPNPLRTAWVERDQSVIDQMVERADAFLVRLDEALAAGEVVEDAQEELPELDELMRKHNVAKANFEKRLEKMRDEISVLMSERGLERYESAFGSTSYAVPSKPSPRFDAAAFKKAEPEIAKRFMVQPEWKQEPVLRVNAPRAKKEEAKK